MARGAAIEVREVGSIDQGVEPTAHLLHHDEGDLARRRRLPRPPIKILDLIGKNNALNTEARRQGYFERIAFRAARNGTHKRQAHPSVVGRRRQH